MRIGVVLGNLRNRLRAFRSETRGNVMITFALALVPIIGFVGAAVDYSRGNSTKAAMQSAVDSTALMLSKEAQSLTTAQLNAKADAMFKALFHRTDIANLTVTPAFLNPGTGSYKLTLTAAGSVPTTFTKVIGQDHISVNVSSQVVWGVKRLELALALDVTGSMASSNKMTELKKAAKSLLTTLKAAAKKDGDIKVAIVPFNIDVNVGSTNVNANWINWAEWEAPPAGSTPASNVGPGSNCPWSTSSNGFQCQVNPTNKSSTTSTVPSSGTYAGYICPTVKGTTLYNGCYNSVGTTTTSTTTVCSGKSSCSCGSTSNCSCSGSGSKKVCTQTTTSTGAPYKHDWVANAHGTWTGCVTDRTQDYDVNNTAPSIAITASLFVAHQYTICPTSLMSLSYDWTALNAKIDALNPDGNTNVTIGLAWAFHALTAAGPFNTAAVPTTDLDKVIILLTDGDNTQNRWTSSQTDIDARTKKACDNVKAANIKLYTVRVIDGNATLLQQCATRSDMYYNVQNSSQLNAVFSAIAQNLANLRIAK
jgi:Flp pilus assembly protein TadG